MDNGHPADSGAAAHVFVEGLDDELELTGEDGHHLARALRLRAGERVTAADGQGRWRVYVVSGTGRDTAALTAAGALVMEPHPAVRLAVAFALTKGDKPELTVQKLTELGADRIVPVIAARSVARPDPAAAARALVRWQRVAREAAKQCRRARLPTVEPLGALLDLAGHPALVVADRTGGGAEDLAAPPGGEVLVVVGPEGGLEAAEAMALAPWARLRLGAHVLRAETAALAAAAVVVGRLGDTRPETEPSEPG